MRGRGGGEGGQETGMGGWGPSITAALEFSHNTSSPSPSGNRQGASNVNSSAVISHHQKKKKKKKKKKKHVKSLIRASPIT